ncbi:MAG: nuclear transport factor 2 family protein [Chloroflexota bacterium]
MSPTRLSKLESAVRVVLEFTEAFNHHDLAGMASLIADDCVFESAAPVPDGAKYVGKEAVAQFWQGFFQEAPHAHLEIEEIFGLGFRCVMRWKRSWLDAAGKKSHVRGVDVFQLRNGLISESLSYVKG